MCAHFYVCAHDCYHVFLYSTFFFFFNYTSTIEIYTYCHTLSLHDALPISVVHVLTHSFQSLRRISYAVFCLKKKKHTSELQSLRRISYAVFCLKKKKKHKKKKKYNKKQKNTP